MSPQRRSFLLLEAASLRVPMDEMASEMKEAPEGKPEMAPPEKLRDCAACLGRSQELDRRFRATIEREAREGIRERLNETTRSRFGTVPKPTSLPVSTHTPSGMH